MSHFCVLVRLPAKTKVVDFEKEINKLMLPYKESGCGSNDPPELKQFLEFTDEEDSHRKKYDTESSDMVRLTTGEEVCLYDDRFRNPDLFKEPRYILPPGAVEFEKSHKERFVTFEEFMEEYCGFNGRDKKKNRYGYWQNPNRKWDWWTIGGRWTGHLLIGYDPGKDFDNYKQCSLCDGSGTRGDTNYPEGEHHCRKPSYAGHPVIGKGCNGCTGTGWEYKWSSDLKPVGNYLRISALNWDQIKEETHKKLNEFWEEWQEFCDGKEYPPF